MTAFDDRYFWSRDGVRLHYRDYPGPKQRPLLLCLPGLTRNARDFEGVAARLAGEWRVLCVDLRGRGDSGYAPDALSYTPLTYVMDVEALIEQLGRPRFVPIGTSLGGILIQLMAHAVKPLMAGALLNDIGPVIEAEGLKRIASYVGRVGPWPTWMHLARHLAETGADIFPDFTISDWLVMAKRFGCVQPSGRIVLDYDPRIAEPFKLPSGQSGVADLWPAFAALADLPLLSVRGERSDILSAQTQGMMAERAGDIETVVVPRVGHAPTLDEPPAVAATERLLARVLARQSMVTP